MALASTTAEAAATNAVATLITYMALHTATTSTTGASENSGGGYTRQSPTGWSAGANTGAMTFTTAGTIAITYAGGWNASSAGTFELGFTLGSSVTAASITIAVGALTIATT